jgi:hypothetical protein
MPTSIQEADRSESENIVNSIKISGDMIKAITESVSAMVNTLIRDNRKTGEVSTASLRNIVNASVRGVVQTGVNLEDGVNAISVGVLKNYSSSSQEIFSSISVLAGAVIKSAADTGVDVSAVVRGLISGVVQSAKAKGIDTGKAAQTAAAITIKEAYNISDHIGSKVKKSAIGSISGVNINFDESFINE